MLIHSAVVITTIFTNFYKTQWDPEPQTKPRPFDPDKQHPAQGPHDTD